MKKKGYQIIEPVILESWTNKLRHKNFTLALLTWLVKQLISANDERMKRVDIEVITVKYISEYPAIGIHYNDPDEDDLGAYIEKRIEDILYKESVYDFLSFYFNNEESWG